MNPEDKIPQDVAEAALKLQQYFTSQGIQMWEFMGVASRHSLDVCRSAARDRGTPDSIMHETVHELTKKIAEMRQLLEQVWHHRLPLGETVEDQIYEKNPVLHHKVTGVVLGMI